MADTLDDIIAEDLGRRLNKATTPAKASAPNPIADKVRFYASKHGLDDDADHLVRMANQESAFNPRATSNKGAMGIMQLMPDTAKRWGVSDAYDVDQNIEAGVKYYSWLKNRYKGDRVKATAAYNAGEGNVDKYGGVPPFKETINYVNRIIGEGAASGNYLPPPPRRKQKGYTLDDVIEETTKNPKLLDGVKLPDRAPVATDEIAPGVPRTINLNDGSAPSIARDPLMEQYGGFMKDPKIAAYVQAERAKNQPGAAPIQDPSLLQQVGGSILAGGGRAIETLGKGAEFIATHINPMMPQPSNVVSDFIRENVTQTGQEMRQTGTRGTAGATNPVMKYGVNPVTEGLIASAPAVAGMAFGVPPVAAITGQAAAEATDMPADQAAIHVLKAATLGSIFGRSAELLQPYSAGIRAAIASRLLRGGVVGGSAAAMQAADDLIGKGEVNSEDLITAGVPMGIIAALTGSAPQMEPPMTTALAPRGIPRPGAPRFPNAPGAPEPWVEGDFTDLPNTATPRSNLRLPAAPQSPTATAEPPAPNVPPASPPARPTTPPAPRPVEEAPPRTATAERPTIQMGEEINIGGRTIRVMDADAMTVRGLDVESNTPRVFRTDQFEQQAGRPVERAPLPTRPASVPSAGVTPTQQEEQRPWQESDLAPVQEKLAQVGDKVAGIAEIVEQIPGVRPPNFPPTLISTAGTKVEAPDDWQNSRAYAAALGIDLPENASDSTVAEAIRSHVYLYGSRKAPTLKKTEPELNNPPESLNEPAPTVQNQPPQLNNSPLPSSQPQEAVGTRNVRVGEEFESGKGTYRISDYVPPRERFPKGEVVLEKKNARGQWEPLWRTPVENFESGDFRFVPPSAETAASTAPAETPQTPNPRVQEIADRYEKLITSDYEEEDRARPEWPGTLARIKRESLQGAQDALDAIQSKDVKRLARLLASGPVSRRVFEEETGIAPGKNQAEWSEAVRQYAGDAAWQSALAAQEAEDAKTKSIRAERDWQQTIKALEEKKYRNPDNTLISAKEMIDEYLARPDVRMETSKRGAVNVYALHGTDPDGRVTILTLTGAAEREYARKRLAERSAVPATDNQPPTTDQPLGEEDEAPAPPLQAQAEEVADQAIRQYEREQGGKISAAVRQQLIQEIADDFDYYGDKTKSYLLATKINVLLNTHNKTQATAPKTESPVSADDGARLRSDITTLTDRVFDAYLRKNKQEFKVLPTATAEDIQSLRDLIAAYQNTPAAQNPSTRISSKFQAAIDALSTTAAPDDRDFAAGDQVTHPRINNGQPMPVTNVKGNFVTFTLPDGSEQTLNKESVNGKKLQKATQVARPAENIPENIPSELAENGNNIPENYQREEKPQEAQSVTLGDLDRLSQYPTQRVQFISDLILDQGYRELRADAAHRHLYNPQSKKQFFLYSNDDVDIARLLLASLPASEEAAESADLVPGTTRLINRVYDALVAGQKMDNPTLTKWATELFGGTTASGKYTPKDAYDAVETAVNKYILEHGEMLWNATPQDAIAKLENLTKLLPTQRADSRTKEQQELQQFSTPPVLSYLAAKALNPTANDVVVEPSAGTGSLAVWARAAGAKVHVNEISPRRRALLATLGFENVTGVDAEFLNSLLPQDIKPTAILMNPPFSSTGGRTKNNTKYGAQHVSDALARLVKNGRLVAIVGEGMALDKPTFIPWWKKKMEKFNVRANIGMDGRNYAKYGTTFDNQVLIFDKTGPTPGKDWSAQTRNVKVNQYREILEAYNALEAIIESRPAPPAVPASAPQAAGASSREPVATTPAGVSSPVGGKSRKPDSGRRTDERPESGTDQPIVREPATEPGAGSVSTGEPGDQSAPIAEGAPVRPGGGSRADVQPGDDLKLEDRQEQSGGKFVEYVPYKVRQGAKHPTKIVESAAMGAVEPPDPTYQPSLPKQTGKKQLSNVQIESIVYAGQRHAQVLPNGQRAGFFIGDGTGVGKGMTIAGIVADNWNQGRRRTVWVSKAEHLRSAAQRDLDDVGAKIPLIAHHSAGASDALKNQDGVLFTTYTLLSTKAKPNQKSRLDQIKEWLGPDGIIIFDEAHQAQNAFATERGNPSATGLAVVKLQKDLPNARVTYVSATGATEVRNMAYMTRLGLWGEGTAFPGGFPDFLKEITEGGVGAMEMVSRDLKALGMYVSRSISFDGVEYETMNIPLTADQKEMYNVAAESWRVIFKNIGEAIETTNGGRNARMMALSQFWGNNQRFFKQLLTAFKVPSVLKRTQKALDENQQVVISLVGTSEAQTSREVTKATQAGLDLEEMDLSPREILVNYLLRSFPIHQHIDVPVPGSDPPRTTQVLLVDENGKPVENPEAVAMRDELLAKMADLKFPAGALDQVIRHFENKGVPVAELTGRKKRIMRNKDTGKMELMKRAPVPMDKINDYEMERFQKGLAPVAIISQAAAEGISLHADKAAASSKKRRVQIALELDWSASKQMQTFGRTHRSNQESAPVMILPYTEVSGEKRFVSTMAKRLGSLGAITKGQRDAATADDDLSKYNFFTREGEAAVSSVISHLEAGNRRDNPAMDASDGMQILDDMGILKRDKDDRPYIDDNDRKDVSRFLNRVLSLDLSRQNRVFGMYMYAFDQLVQMAKENGTFDDGVEDVRAEAIRMVKSESVYQDPTTGAKTEYKRLELDRKVPPYAWSRATSAARREEGARFVRQKNSGKVSLLIPSRYTETDENGSVYRMVSLYRPEDEYGRKAVRLSEIDEKYETVPADEAEAQWNERYDAAPRFTTTNLHVLSGAILPIWNKLKAANSRSMKIVRVKTDTGERVVGIDLPANSVHRVLRTLGLGQQAMSASQVYDAVSDGAVVELIDGLMLVLSKLRGEPTIKVSGNLYRHRNTLREQDLIEELNYGSSTFYVPTDNEKGVAALTKLLKVYPMKTAETSGPDVSMQEEFAAQKNPGVFNGRRFWIGTVNAQDGQVENVYTYETAAANDFHHSMYMGAADQEGVRDGERFVFWIDENGSVQGEWREKAPKDILARIREQVQIRPVKSRGDIEASPEFRRWFGDSKVVDADGKPLIVYHGTSRAGFSLFDAYGGNYGLFGDGVYTTENPAIASTYTSKGKGDAKAVYPVYLSLQRPMEMAMNARRSEWQKAFVEIEFPSNLVTNEDFYRAVEEEFQYEGMYASDAREGLQAGLRQMGYDGITHIGGGRIKSDSTKHAVFIAFDPEQIKSAFNKGTFDPDNPNISEARDWDGRETFDPKRMRVRETTATRYDVEERNLFNDMVDDGMYRKEVRRAPLEVGQKVFQAMYLGPDGNPLHGRIVGETRESAEQQLRSIHHDFLSRPSNRQQAELPDFDTPEVTPSTSTVAILNHVRSEYRPATNEEPAVIYGNRQTTIVLQQAVTHHDLTRLKNEAKVQGFHVSTDDAAKIAIAITRMTDTWQLTEDQFAHLDELRHAFASAATGEGSVIYIDADRTRSLDTIFKTKLHENIHAAQLRANRQRRDVYLVSSDWLAQDPDYDQLKTSPVAEQFKYDGEKLAAEAVAYILAGDRDAMGYAYGPAGRQQAAAFVGRYLAEAVRQHGVFVLSSFHQYHPDFTELFHEADTRLEPGTRPRAERGSGAESPDRRDAQGRTSLQRSVFPGGTGSGDAGNRADAQGTGRGAVFGAGLPVEFQVNWGGETTKEAGRKLADVFRSGLDSLRKTWSPTSIGVSGKQTGAIMREQMARMARQGDIAEQQLRDASKALMKLSEDTRWGFVYLIETGQTDKLPVGLRPFADAIRELLDQRRDEVQRLGDGKLQSFYENYFPHIWENPDKAQDVFAQYFGKRPFEGSKSFLKQRKIPTIEHGRAMGLVPISDNPVDLVLLKLREMDRYLMAHRVLKEMEREGLIEFVKATERAPDYFTKIDDKVSTIFGPSVIPGMVTIRGHLYAPLGAAQVLNNYLSPGLRSKAWFRGWQSMGNALNQMQLGWSFFHFGFTSLDAMISKTALGIHQLTRGNIYEAAKAAVQTPIAPIENILRGNKLYHAWEDPGSMGTEWEQVVQAMTAGGGRIKMDSFYQSGMIRQMKRAFKDQSVAGFLKGVGLSPLAATEFMSKLLMEYVVPRQKLGVFADLAKAELLNNPNMTRAELRDTMAKIWDSVDNRMGQLVYDNLFWNKTAKDLTMAAFRSVGWNLGTKREVGGGVIDTAKFATNVAARMAGRGGSGGGGKKPPHLRTSGDEWFGGDPQVSYRMEYIAALAIVTGITGAILNYLFTGERPEDAKDYFFPRTGGKDDEGNPERFAMPSYAKDIYAYYRHPGRTFAHKVHPLLSVTGELLKNEDFFGVQIRDEDDNFLQRRADDVKHIGKSFLPFSVRNTMEMRDRGDGITAKTILAPAFGLTPASKEVGRTEAQQMVKELLGKKMGDRTITEDEFEETRRKRELRVMIQNGQDVTGELNKEIQTGRFTMREAQNVLKSKTESAFERGYRQLGIADALDVWEKASTAERQSLKPILASKSGLIHQVPLTQRADVLARFNQAFAQ